MVVFLVIQLISSLYLLNLDFFNLLNPLFNTFKISMLFVPLGGHDFHANIQCNYKLAIDVHSRNQEFNGVP